MKEKQKNKEKLITTSIVRSLAIFFVIMGYSNEGGAQWTTKLQWSFGRDMCERLQWNFGRGLALALLAFFLTISSTTNAQWMLINENGGSPHTSAALEISDTTKGFLAPRLTSAQMNAIPVPALGLLVFNTTVASFYYYDGSSWVDIPVNGSDDLGNHTATQTIQLSGNKISNDGDNEGVGVANNGIVTLTPAATGAGNVALIPNGDVRTVGQGTGYYMTNASIGMTGNNGNSGDMRFKTGGTDRIRITGGGQVGIGTNSPSTKLHVTGTAAADGSSGQIQIDETGGNSMMLGRTASFGFIQTQNSEALVLNPTSNNVGIGTSSPNAQLHVGGKTQFTGDDDAITFENTGGVKQATIGITDGNGRFNIYQGADSSGDYYIQTGEAATRLRMHNTGFHFYTAPSGTADDLVPWDEQVTILNTGLVGIGQGTPTSKLHVLGNTTIDQTAASTSGFVIRRSDDLSNVFRVFTGTGENGNLALHDASGSTVVRLSGGIDNSFINGSNNLGVGITNPQNKLHVNTTTTATRLQLTNTTSGSGSGDGLLISSDATNAIITNQESGDIEFNTNGADRMIIKPDGDVGIGTASPANILHVEGTKTSDAIVYVHNTSGNIQADGIYVQTGANNNPGNSNAFLRCMDGDGDIIGKIVGNGSGGVTYNTTSDRRLKTKIEDYSSGLNLVMKLQPRLYERKSLFGKKEIGFIAQELQQVLPMVVSGDSTIDVKVDPMGVDYGLLTPVLTAAIQDLNEIIQTQQKQIEQLQATSNSKTEENNQLKSQLDNFEHRLRRLEFLIEEKQSKKVESDLNN